MEWSAFSTRVAVPEVAVPCETNCPIEVKAGAAGVSVTAFAESVGEGELDALGRLPSRLGIGVVVSQPESSTAIATPVETAIHFARSFAWSTERFRTVDKPRPLVRPSVDLWRSSKRVVPFLALWGILPVEMIVPRIWWRRVLRLPPRRSSNGASGSPMNASCE
jgi:hypothetical protein